MPTVWLKIGSGNFAAVLKIKEKATNKDFALKIIDKSMCKGKEHYIDAEVRVMKKLNHPHIMSLYKDIDTSQNMYLILEYVSGKTMFVYFIIRGKNLFLWTSKVATYSMLLLNSLVSRNHKQELW